MKSAFTLAEVLITLGIIGIVASLTMPALVQDARKKEVSSRLAKFYSMMSQALLTSEQENGLIEDWGKQAMQYDEDGNYDTNANSEISDAFFRKYIAPYFKYVSAEKDADFNYYTKVALADGSVMHVRNGGCYDIYYDINGDKKPNDIGRDKFFFIICTPINSAKAYFDYGMHFGPYCAPKADTREEAIELCKKNRNFCARILQMDNWEIKDDYPVKI